VIEKNKYIVQKVGPGGFKLEETTTDFSDGVTDLVADVLGRLGLETAEKTLFE
jgi:hypothetical protein